MADTVLRVTAAGHCLVLFIVCCDLWAWLPSKSPAELLSEAAAGEGKTKTCNQAGLYKAILRQQVQAMQDPAIRQDLIAGPYCRVCNKYFLRQLVQAGQGPALSSTSAFQPSLSPHLPFSLSIIAKARPKGVTAFSYKKEKRRYSATGVTSSARWPRTWIGFLV